MLLDKLPKDLIVKIATIVTDDCIARADLIMRNEMLENLKMCSERCREATVGNKSFMKFVFFNFERGDKFFDCCFVENNEKQQNLEQQDWTSGLNAPSQNW